MELWRSQGSKVAEATWDMTLPQEQLSAEADKMRAEGNHLLFTHLTGDEKRNACSSLRHSPSALLV